jgi:acyl carrier protein
VTAPSERPDPFAVVAEALGCPRALLSLDSGMYKTHGWDSFGHITVIVALEAAYGISIPNEEMLSLNSIKAILKRFQPCEEAETR